MCAARESNETFLEDNRSNKCGIDASHQEIVIINLSNFIGRIDVRKAHQLCNFILIQIVIIAIRKSSETKASIRDEIARTVDGSDKIIKTARGFVMNLKEVAIEKLDSNGDHGNSLTRCVQSVS